ncbi:MAG: helix-turn-helix domain-containing protein, partial [Bacteroidota bacterium]
LMFHGKRHYKEFLSSDERPATNILATRLKNLEAAGIIRKEKDPTNGKRRIYRLTEKGVALLPMMTEFTLWSADWDPETLAYPQILAMIKEDKAGYHEKMQKKLIAEHLES